MSPNEGDHDELADVAQDSTKSPDVVVPIANEGGDNCRHLEVEKIQGDLAKGATDAMEGDCTTHLSTKPEDGAKLNGLAQNVEVAGNDAIIVVYGDGRFRVVDGTVQFTVENAEGQKEFTGEIGRFRIKTLEREMGTSQILTRVNTADNTAQAYAATGGAIISLDSGDIELNTGDEVKFNLETGEVLNLKKAGPSIVEGEAGDIAAPLTASEGSYQALTGRNDLDPGCNINPKANTGDAATAALMFMVTMAALHSKRK